MYQHGEHILGMFDSRLVVYQFAQIVLGVNRKLLYKRHHLFDIYRNE
ncbi:hypothetical protein BASH2_03742 [Bacillus anthracis]|nr:hypothetical protein BASH2_03742 [Bacillus anthracis]